jgi:hypothetical protein
VHRSRWETEGKNLSIPFFPRSGPIVNAHSWPASRARQKASRAHARTCARALSGAAARGRTGSKPRAQGGLGLAGLPRTGVPHVQLARVLHGLHQPTSLLF